jgi:amidase
MTLVKSTPSILLSTFFALLLIACNPDNPVSNESASDPAPVAVADYTEYSIDALQALMQKGELTSGQLTRFYLGRIEAIDRNGPALNSIIEINPEAMEIAAALDTERQENGPRGPMHGIPVILKANIDTADQMETTAGSLALKGHRPPDDAFVVKQLRKAGAVILGKANLSEWANFRSDWSSSGWSSIGGQTKNPYDLARNPCGSSSGSAVSVAASLTSVAVGTETNGSIVCPASVNGIVGIKPTLGLVSRSGIIPIAHSQDTAGPMGRTVKDAAIMFNAMVGRDTADPLADSFPESVPDFTANLSKDALQGARIGVYRGHYGAGRDARVEKIVEDTIATLESLGAEIIDPVDIETGGMGSAPSVMPHFGQESMLAAEEKGPLTDEVYLQALVDSKRIAQSGIDGALQNHNLDALIAPTRGTAWLTDHINGDQSTGISSSSLAAVSGYASVTVPAGDVLGLPIGISFIGAAFSDARLIGFAHAFEQAGYQRKKPPLDD